MLNRVEWERGVVLAYGSNLQSLFCFSGKASLTLAGLALSMCSMTMSLNLNPQPLSQ